MLDGSGVTAVAGSGTLKEKYLGEWKCFACKVMQLGTTTLRNMLGVWLAPIGDVFPFFFVFNSLCKIVGWNKR